MAIAKRPRPERPILRGIEIREARLAAGLSLTEASRLIAAALDRPWKKHRDRAHLAWTESCHQGMSDERMALILSVYRAASAGKDGAR